MTKREVERLVAKIEETDSVYWRTDSIGFRKVLKVMSTADGKQIVTFMGGTYLELDHATLTEFVVLTPLESEFSLF